MRKTHHKEAIFYPDLVLASGLLSIEIPSLIINNLMNEACIDEVTVFI